MNFIKIIIIVLVALSCWTGAYSQTRMPWNDKITQAVMNGTPYIFEGVVIDTLYYNGVTGLCNLTQEYALGFKPLIPIKPLTAVKVQIIHVFRGNLNPGTVEMVDDFGGFWDNGIFMYMMIGERTTPMRPGTKAIFFCNKSTYKPSPMITDNEIRVVPLMEEINFSIRDYFKPGGNFEKEGRGFKAFGKIFSSKNEFYQFLSKYRNISIPKDTVKIEEPPLKQTQAQKAEADSIKQVQNKLLYEERKKNYQQYEQNLKLKNKQQKKK